MRPQILRRPCRWSALLAAASFAVALPAFAEEAPERVEDESQWTSTPPPPPPDSGQVDDEDDDDDEDFAADDDAQAYTAPQPDLAPAAPAVAPTLQSFQATLSPYGAWVQVPGLGLVWQPYASVVGTDFVPYETGGSWVYTTVGWQFRSQWAWGWAPFHYGRWHHASGYGWVWWPSYSWGAAWVDWRYNGSYIAWSPMAPPGFRMSFGLGTIGWNYAPYRYFGRPYISRYTLRPTRWNNGWAWARRDRHVQSGYSWYRHSSPGHRSWGSWNNPYRGGTNHRSNGGWNNGYRGDGYRGGGWNQRSNQGGSWGGVHNATPHQTRGGWGGSGRSSSGSVAPAPSGGGSWGGGRGHGGWGGGNRGGGTIAPAPPSGGNHGASGGGWGSGGSSGGGWGGGNRGSGGSSGGGWGGGNRGGGSVSPAPPSGTSHGASGGSWGGGGRGGGNGGGGGNHGGGGHGGGGRGH